MQVFFLRMRRATPFQGSLSKRRTIKRWVSNMRHVTFLFLLLLVLSLISAQNVVGADPAPSLPQDGIPSIVNLLLRPCSNNTFPLEYGRWDAPDEVFTLPPLEDATGYYYPDIQASFPEVDWQSLNRLYIPAGHYKFIRIGNLPVRSVSNRLVITNKGGQVRVGGLGHYYLFVLSGGKNWILTGRYDPESQTGDSRYPGHWGGAYVASRNSYGILVDDEYVRDGISGISIGGRATDFEVEFVEIRHVGFAGMVIKTDDDGTATMENITIHDTYIHDTLSEGFYIGSTQKQPQHLVRNLEMYNNRVIRAGTEAIQIGNLGGNITIHHNVFALAAVHWKDAFQPWQDGNMQIGTRTGNIEISDNIFIGAAGNIVFVSGKGVAGDNYPAISTVRFKNNYFSSTRNLFFYLRNDEHPGLQYELDGNYFSHMDFQRQEINPAAVSPNEMIRTFTPVPLVFKNNTWNTDLDFSNPLADGNGTNNNVSGSDNIKRTPPELRFCKTGLKDDFDWLKLEVWAATASRGNDQPVEYEHDDIVMYMGQPYHCKLTICPPGMIPPDNPAIWQEMSYFSDDWRLESGLGLDGIGLQY